VALLDAYLSADPPCLKYEYVAGGDLAGLIQHWHRGASKPTPTHTVRVMRRLAEIVAFAHDLEPAIVHRDLKPANVLVQRLPDGAVCLKVADFGIGGVAVSQAVRQTARGSTQGGMLVSSLLGSYTPLYASPQQMRGSVPDPRDDVYALGVIWYQLLTGELTSGRPGGNRWQARLRERGASAELLELLVSCFEDNAEDRPAKASALVASLDRLTAG
jgi:serine/threonine protein kinase